MSTITEAVAALKRGEIIAYPTESTWGLGVDANNQHAVTALSQLKNRPQSKAFIVLVDNLDRIKHWIDFSQLPTEIDPNKGWPGPITKLFPIAPACPTWLSLNNRIAVRVSAHPITMTLCHAFSGPVISTSANPSGKETLATAAAITTCFGKQISTIVPGEPGGQPPTRIVCLVTGTNIR